MTVTEGPSDAARARFLEVDGLKGLAVAAVVAYQISRFGAFPPSAPAAVARVFTDMSQGFGLFLMLAAFLFAYPLLAALRAEGSSTLDTGRYLCGRAIRVYPAYFVVAALAALLHPLGTLFGYPALAHAAPPIDFGTFARNAVFAAGGLRNDGLHAVGLLALAFALLPILLTLWTRLPRVAVYLAIVAAVLDTLTRAHGFGIGIAVPLVLGIAAADLRVREHRSQRFGLAIAAGATILAFVFEPHIAALPGALQAPGALRIDPFWALAWFGIVVACGALAKLRLVLGNVAFRAASAPAYAATLVAMPIAEFAARQMPPLFGSFQAALVTAAVIAVVAYALWQGVDRTFARESVRRRVAARPGTIVDGLLARARIATVTYRYPPPKPVPAPETHDDVADRSDVPPMPQAELARLSTRTGSPEDLAAEIFETKKRLTERTSESPAFDVSSSPLPAAFAPRHAPQPQALPIVVNQAPVIESPVTEAPVVEAPVAEAPVVAAVIEAPVVEAAIIDAAVVEAPVVAAVVETPVVATVIEAAVVEAPVVEAPVIEAEIAAPLPHVAPAPDHVAEYEYVEASPQGSDHDAGEPVETPFVAAGPNHDVVAANASRVLAQHTAATLTALVENVEAERELEAAVPRPAIRMRIGPPRARSAETTENEEALT